MDDILMPIGEELGINVMTGAGEFSLTRCAELVAKGQPNGNWHATPR
jgi:hypothetical protein